MLGFLRLVLAFVFFWVVLRLIREVTRVMSPRRRPDPRSEVHPGRPRGRNLGDGHTVIDVDYTEKRRDPRSGD